MINRKYKDKIQSIKKSWIGLNPRLYEDKPFCLRCGKRYYRTFAQCECKRYDPDAMASMLRNEIEGARH